MASGDSDVPILFPPIMDNQETILPGGRSTESVVRIGDFVHRSIGSNAPFVHGLLRHLERVQFPYAPRYTGQDPQGREILTFLDGEVVVGQSLTETQLQDAILILRQLHDAAANSPLRGDHETICHHDFAPWNLIMHRDSPVGIIDFDEAAPGSRIEDVAYFLWTFLDLGGPDSSPDIISLIAKLVKTYQLSRPEELVTAILDQQERILDKRKGIVKNSPVEAEVRFSQEAILRIQQEMLWTETHRSMITMAVLPTASD